MSVSMLTMLGALGAELLLIVLVLLTVAWFRNRAARRRDLQAIEKLVGRVKARKPEREKAIADFLEQRVGLSGEALGEAQATLLGAELVLLHRFASIYSQRDAAATARLDDDLVAALQPYSDLQISSQSAEAETSAEAVPRADSNTAELETLREENRRLSKQLQVGMETMGQMLNEYSAMFDSGTKGTAPPSTAALAGVQAAAEDLEEAAPAAEPAAGSDVVPVAADESVGKDPVPLSEPDPLPADEAEADASVAGAVTETGPQTSAEPSAEAAAVAEPDTDTDDVVSSAPERPTETAAADDVAEDATESAIEPATEQERVEDVLDEIEVLSDALDGAEPTEPGMDEGADDSAEPELAQVAEPGDVTETSTETAPDADGTLPKAQTGS